MSKSSRYKGYVGVQFNPRSGWIAVLRRQGRLLTRGPFQYEAWAIEARRIMEQHEGEPPATAELRSMVQAVATGEPVKTLRNLQRERGRKPYTLAD